MTKSSHTTFSCRVLATIVLTASAPLPQAPESNTAGHWEGTIEIPQNELVVIVDLERMPSSWSGTISIPSQGAEGLPLERISVEESRITFRIAGAEGQPTFEGRVEAAELRGTFRQSGAEFPFRLSREKVALLARPQEPRPPFPYRSEEVTYRNGEVVLGGTLTLPEGKGPFPAAVLITGSGAQNRDEALLGHKPFLVLADHLTRAGIAVLRSDDRGVGASSGSVDRSTSEDFARDALAGVRILASRPEIDPARIGLIGHSEGGLVAPLAATLGEGVAYLVLLAGTGVPGAELIPKQVERLARASGVPEERALHEADLARAAMDALTGDVSEDVRRSRLIAFVRSQAELGVPELGDEQAALEELLTPWFLYFLKHDPRPVLARVTIPVLALNGELDTQVDAEQNLPAIENALASAGNQDATVVWMPGLNHLFQHARTGSPQEYASIEETLAPEVLERVTGWILERFGSH